MSHAQQPEASHHATLPTSTDIDALVYELRQAGTDSTYEIVKAALSRWAAPATLAVEPVESTLSFVNGQPAKCGCHLSYSDGGGEYSNVGRVTLCTKHAGAERNGATPPAQAQTFQQRAQPWMQECFGAEISADGRERNHRFLEEALELVQALGCTESEARQLVAYVYGRPEGEPAQEVGGVMVTLAALCLAHGLDMHAAGDVELARIWTKVDAIRAKQAAKPKHSPLPMHAPQAQDVQPRLVLDAEWSARLLDGRPLVRDKMGFGGHPDLPLMDEGMKPRAFFDALGIELKHTMAEDDLDMDEQEAMNDAGNWNGWAPQPPAGEGWKLVAIFDTEDGTAAWWLRDAYTIRDANKASAAQEGQA